MLCENCQKDHDGSYATGRFCSAKCSRGFSTKSKRKEINGKVSAKLKGRKVSTNIKGKRRSVTWKHTEASKEKLKQRYLTRREKKLAEVPFEMLTRDFKRIVIFREQNGACNHCNLSEWRGHPMPLELEHKDGDNQNDARDNLELLCHNCHALTLTWRGRNVRAKKKEKITDQQLKEALFLQPSVAKALLSLGLNGKGKHYSRVKRLIKEMCQDPQVKAHFLQSSMKRRYVL